MRHKTFLINPEIIYDKGIEVHKCIQMPGEFVITFGGSYHAGFNMGFNCAEAVNFATKNWIDLGIRAKICKCQKDSVQINMGEFVKNIYEKKIIKKKELEEFNENINKNMSKSFLKINANDTNVNHSYSKSDDDNDNNKSTDNSRLVEKKKKKAKKIKKLKSNSSKGLIKLEKNLNLKRKIKVAKKVSIVRKKRVRKNFFIFLFILFF